MKTTRSGRKRSIGHSYAPLFVLRIGDGLRNTRLYRRPGPVLIKAVRSGTIVALNVADTTRASKSK